MILATHPTPDAANAAAADCLANWLAGRTTRNVMVAAGNTPIDLYRRIGALGLPLSHLNLFALDEYVGVPPDEPRNCANLLRRCVGEAWGIPPDRFHAVSSLETRALASVLDHERGILEAGGLDIVILGLGQNGHLGFNEPGSAEDSTARVLDLDDISIRANRAWFRDDYAPSRGATVGMKTLLAARRVLLLAYGPHKADAVKAMAHGPRTPDCPASLLQGHAEVRVFLDEAAAAKLEIAG
jgi:glucosamine-6-phosphate deaminase